MIVFSAAESKVQSVLDDRVSTKNTKIKEVCGMFVMDLMDQ